MRMLQFIASLLFVLSTCKISCGGIENLEEEGYFMREHSLVQPYHGKFSQLKIDVLC